MKCCQKISVITLGRPDHRYPDPICCISGILDGQRDADKRPECINKGRDFLLNSWFGASAAYFEKVLGQVRQSVAPGNVVIGEYMCQGKMPQSVRERYIKMKENPEHPANLDLLIKNFDCALSHPDTDDLEKLKKIIMK